MSAPAKTTGFNYITDLLAQSLDEVRLLEIRGRITQITGTIIRAMVPGAKIGELCLLRNPNERFELKAEVVGFSGKEALLTPMGDLYGLSSNTEVIPTGKMQMVPVGSALLGRVLNGMGEPLDVAVHGPLLVDEYYPIYQDAPDPMTRRIIDKPLALGLRVLEAHREQNTAQAVRRQQQVVGQQARTLQQARDDAAQFHTHRLHEEQRLFAEIKGQLVVLLDDGGKMEVLANISPEEQARLVERRQRPHLDAPSPQGRHQ